MSNYTRAREQFNRAATSVASVPRKIWRYAKRKPIRALLIASLATGTATQFAPATVSTSLDDYMASKGAPALSPYYTTKSIRVMSRYNPLQAPHMTVFSIRTNGPYILDAPLDVPYSIAKTAFHAGITTIIPTTLDAYSFSNAEDDEKRLCFIRPPARTSLRNYLNAFSTFDASRYAFANQDVLGQAFFTYIMAHEARHCDQRGWGVSNAHIKESDADIYALKAVRSIYGDAYSQELSAMLGHIRTIMVIRHDDEDHASSRALLRDEQSVALSLHDKALYAELRELLKAGVEDNEYLFDEGDYSKIAKYYHVATALLQDSRFTDPDMRRVTSDFIAAVAYFDQHTPDQLVAPLPQSYIINTANLTTYTPAPGPLNKPVQPVKSIRAGA